MKRIRIAHIIDRLEPGGSERNTLYTVTHLNRSIFEPYLIAGPGGILDQQALELKEVSVRFCSELSREVRPLADHETFLSLRTMLREIKPDIVHTHRAKAGIVGRLAASAENIPFIVHTYHRFAFHRFQPEGVTKLALALEREACRRSNHLAFVSNANIKTAEDLDLIQSSEFSLIRTGVEVEPLLSAQRSEEFRSEYGISSKSKVVGMIGYLRPQKDPLTFVEAAAIVAKKEPNTKFLLFGDGDMAGAVAKRASKILSRENFLQPGWGKNIPEALANFDLLVVPSLWEGLPVVIPEATILGVPVIATPVDGNVEVVLEGRNGAFAEPQNAKDFARKIRKALDQNWTVDPALSRKIQYEYDIRELVRKYEAIYLNLAN